MNNEELFRGLPLLRQTIADKVFLFEREIEKMQDPELKAGLKKERDRWIFRNDLWALAKVTGHDLFVEHFHRGWCEWVSLQNWQVGRFLSFPIPVGMPEPDQVLESSHPAWEEIHRLWLLFRGAFKTTIISKIHTLQLLLNFSDLRIALTHFNQDIASQRLVSVKELFKSKAIRNAFPECVPPDKDWGSRSQVSLANRRQTTQDEASLTAIGISTTTTGSHFDLFKDDDIVTDKSVTTEEQLRQSSDWLDRSISLYTNPTLRIRDTIGTRYHHADAYSKLKDARNVFLIEVPVLVPLKEGGEAITDRGEVIGKSVLPELRSIKGIQDLIRNSLGGLWEFMCQQMMQPSDPALNQFHPDQIVTYDQMPERLNIVISVDPASSRKRSSDYTAVKVIGIDPTGKWYWLDGIYDRLDVFERVKAVCDLVERWSRVSMTTTTLLYEAIAFQNSDVKFFQRLREERQLRCRTIEIKAHTKRKDDRIRGLIPKYKKHEILWPQEMKRYSKTEGKVIDLVEMQRMEFLKFPLGGHDDFLDTEGFLLMVDLLAPDVHKEKKSIEGTWKHAHNRLKQFHELRGHYLNAEKTDEEVWQDVYGDEALVGVSERYA